MKGLTGKTSKAGQAKRAGGRKGTAASEPRCQAEGSHADGRSAESNKPRQAPEGRTCPDQTPRGQEKMEEEQRRDLAPAQTPSN